MKTKFLAVILFATGYTACLFSEIVPYYSITNFSRHVTNYNPNKILSAAWPKISTNTEDFYYPSQTHFQGVKFIIGLSNNAVVLGETNFLFCKIDNWTTNFIVYWSYTYAYITNNSAGYYELSPRVMGPSRNVNGGPMNTFGYIQPPSFFNVSAGSTKEWLLPFVIGLEVHPGSYKIKASQGVVSDDAKYSWEIPANSIDVEIVK